MKGVSIERYSIGTSHAAWKFNLNNALSVSFSDPLLPDRTFKDLSLDATRHNSNSSKNAAAFKGKTLCATFAKLKHFSSANLSVSDVIV